MAKWPYNTTAWRKLRALKLAGEPLCEGCDRLGLLVTASHVDHRKPISDGGDPFPALDALASLCRPCHSAKTARGVEAGAVKTGKPRRGCSPDGTPLDPSHPWSANPIERKISQG
ncbi:HNH endonuclease signature motif containing protein [uncultured Novosphingobium sp.]|uniref:HNH endonuclease signature motif containing protein n=1 Tax=uncultured Novosphingobium sp. TaxID=292277 RepID=UPI003749619E